MSAQFPGYSLSFVQGMLTEQSGRASGMHVHNFASSRNSRGLLFLNLHPEVFLDYAISAQFLGALFGHYGIAQHRVVLDIPGYLLKLEQLGEAIAAYRALGCLICIDGGQIGAELSATDAPAPQAVDLSGLIEHVDGDWSTHASIH
jgi:EAL domain-containing protein (putative c-di-GMP-specific phosphodiesterase class I)